MPETPLTGKVALVTGASKGIGKAIALGYAAAGASVCCAARNAEALDEVVSSIQQISGNALAVVTDVGEETSVSALMQTTTEHFGGLDILVVNAGVNFEQQSLEHTDSTAWQQTINVNLMGAYYCIKHAIPHLKEREAGKIITIGSGLGHHGRGQDSAYACSKAALWMLTRVVAQELASTSVCVNELIPGPVDTGMSTEAFRKQVVDVYHEWFKQPEDVVDLAVFLASQPAGGPSAQSFSLMRRAF
ncbi:MAG: SDR family oxidoreductase [Deinococcota bacterium]